MRCPPLDAAQAMRWWAYAAPCCNTFDREHQGSHPRSHHHVLHRGWPCRWRLPQWRC